MVNVFRFLDYRDILKNLVASRKKEDKKFSFSSLAEILGVQKTYLSKVMNNNGSLNSDQIYSLVEFFSLSKGEHDYILLLLECERTGLAKRRQKLEKRIAAIQAEQRNTKKILKAKFSAGESQDPFAEYYLDPFMTVVHICLTLPEYNGSAERIAQKFNFSDSYSKKIFSSLERLGIIEKTKSNHYKVLDDHLQLSSDSPLCTPYHILFRALSANYLVKVPSDERFAFSVTFSADDKAKKQIHEAFLKFLREIEPVIKSAPAKEVLQINFDLFPW